MLMILDADLSVAPEDLPQFYEAMVSRVGESSWARGSYGMDPKAMRLNVLGNRFFSLLERLIGQPIKDTLCGTRSSARGLRPPRRAGPTGEFDPFSGYDLISAPPSSTSASWRSLSAYTSAATGRPISALRRRWLLLRMSAPRSASSSRHERCGDPGAAPCRGRRAPSSARCIASGSSGCWRGGGPSPGRRGRLGLASSRVRAVARRHRRRSGALRGCPLRRGRAPFGRCPGLWMVTRSTIPAPTDFLAEVRACSSLGQARDGRAVDHAAVRCSPVLPPRGCRWA
jgi:hypothetical protein